MTDLSGVNEALKSGYTIKLENRGPRSSGLTFELKTVFDEMAKKGLIKDKDGKGLTQEDALNMYAKLNEIHQSEGMDTNYSQMQAGQEIKYSAEQLLALAESSGYEVVESTPETTVQASVNELPEDMNINHPPVVYQPEDEPKPQLSSLPKGAKQKLRDIKNVGPEGSKETVVTTKNKDGVKVYHQVETDPKTGEAKMGKRLAVDGRGLKKNEYYAIDETIPYGAEVDTNKTVDGKKDVMTYTVKEKDGKTNRYTMVQNEDKTYTKGELLVPIYGSNKFMSQSALNKHISPLFPNGVPEGVEVQLMDINGNATPIFKKDGQTLTSSQLRQLAQVEVKEDAAEVTTPTEVKTKKDKNKSKITDEFRTQIKTMRTGVSGLDYSISDDGNIKVNGNVSLINSDFLAIQHDIYHDKKTGIYRKANCKSRSSSILSHEYTLMKQNLCLNQALYNQLSQKSELTEAEQNFMQRHEQAMHEFLTTAKSSVK